MLKLFFVSVQIVEAHWNGCDEVGVFFSCCFETDGFQHYGDLRTAEAWTVLRVCLIMADDDAFGV